METPEPLYQNCCGICLFPYDDPDHKQFLRTSVCCKCAEMITNDYVALVETSEPPSQYQNDHQPVTSTLGELISIRNGNVAWAPRRQLDVGLMSMGQPPLDPDMFMIFCEEGSIEKSGGTLIETFQNLRRD